MFCQYCHELHVYQTNCFYNRKLQNISSSIICTSIYLKRKSLFSTDMFWLCFFFMTKKFVHKFRVDLYKSCFILKKTYHFTLDMFDLIFVYIYITKKVVIVNSNVWLFIRQQWRRWLLDTTRRISLTLNFRKSGAILKMRRIEKVCVNSPSYKHFNPF